MRARRLLYPVAAHARAHGAGVETEKSDPMQAYASFGHWRLGRPDAWPELPWQDDVVDRVRIDKWLWAARFAKTRSAATELVLGGHVKVAGGRVKPAREVGPGDTVEIRTGPVRRTVVVTGVADRRGPAKVAATLYEETAESLRERERLAGERRLARPLGADLGARPTKLERRRLEALRRGQRRR